MLKPIEKTNVSYKVFFQLREKILNGELPPGKRLPSERTLCEMLRVNRSSVREALKRLEHARLIVTRHGQGSTVLDFRRSAGLDIFSTLIAPERKPDVLAIRSIVEVRGIIGPEIARYAARRAQAEDLSRLQEIVSRIGECRGNISLFQELDFEFHHTLARASENLVFILLLNSIREIYLSHRSFFQGMFYPAMTDPARYRRIVASLHAGDEGRAYRLVKALLDEGNENFYRLLGKERKNHERDRIRRQVL